MVAAVKAAEPMIIADGMDTPPDMGESCTVIHTRAMHPGLLARCIRWFAAGVLLVGGCGGGDSGTPQRAPSRLLAAAGAPSLFAGARASYVVTRTGNAFAVYDTVSGSAVQVPDNLSMTFADRVVNPVTAVKAATLSARDLQALVELYIAFFNRVPDADGMAFWIDQVARGQTVDWVADRFYEAALQYPDITHYTSTMTAADFVRIVYRNVLGRSGSTAPPDEDVQFWAGELTSGRATRGSLIRVMLDSAHSFKGNATWGWVPDLLDNKYAVGRYFAIDQALNFATPQESISKGVAIAAAVTPTSTRAAMDLIGVTDAAFARSAPGVPAVAVAGSLLAETGVTSAAQRYGVTGAGVAVAILDRGIDWSHPDFRHADGSTRIAYIFDLTDDSGAHSPGNPYGAGTIYTKAQIDAANSGGATLATRDAVGHGTASAGLCCSNGRAAASGKYAGVAPESTLIVVKITSDGAPAHGDQRAEAAFWDPSRLPIAIDFARDKARELGLPCVMFANIGSMLGPADGTSSLAAKIDATVGPGIPGLVFLTGSSDDGGGDNHASGALAAGQTAHLKVNKAIALSLVVDIWYAGADLIDLTIQTPTSTTGPLLAPPGATGYATQDAAEFTYYHYGSAETGVTNGKRHIYLLLKGAAGTYDLQLRGAQVASGAWDAALNPSPYFLSPRSTFLTFATPGKTIWDAASAFHNVVPNSYVYLVGWTDIDGYAHTDAKNGTPGDLWPGSGIGPTWDGRIGIDVSAPGTFSVASYGPNSYWATLRGNLVQGGGGWYGLAGAVSAANPITAGVIALMLQQDPTLDAARTKSILQRTARVDTATGVVPNTRWGYGKLDAAAALDIVAGRPPGTAR